MNYKHLEYFWAVAHAGGVARAAERLHVTPQTLSGQVKLLEDRLGKRLLRKVGRGVELTPAGRLALRYADDIFSAGAEMLQALAGDRAGDDFERLRVGVSDSVPKSVAYHVLEPAMARPGVRGTTQLVCSEGKLSSLVSELAVHRLDLVISDVPLPGNVAVRAFSHVLGRSDNSFFAAPKLLKAHGVTRRPALEVSLKKLPMLLPGPDSALRPRLENWLGRHGLSPVVTGEFDDTALMKAFGREGRGVFVAPTVLEKEICDQYGVIVLGRASDLAEEFYAISVERRITHPAVAAITDTARRKLFG